MARMRTDPEVTQQGIHRRVRVNGLEQDVHGPWRKWYCFTQRAGVCKSVKQVGNRRERRTVRQSIRKYAA